MEDLRFMATRLSSGQDGLKGERWRELIHSFRSTKWFRVAGGLSTDIVLALLPFLRLRRTVLPALHKLHTQEPELHSVPSREAVSSFMELRWLSGRIIRVEYERL